MGSGGCIEDPGELDAHDVVDAFLELLEVALYLAATHPLLHHFLTLGLHLLPQPLLVLLLALESQAHLFGLLLQFADILVEELYDLFLLDRLGVRLHLLLLQLGYFTLPLSQLQLQHSHLLLHLFLLLLSAFHLSL